MEPKNWTAARVVLCCIYDKELILLMLPSIFLITHVPSRSLPGQVRRQCTITLACIMPPTARAYYTSAEPEQASPSHHCGEYAPKKKEKGPRKPVRAGQARPTTRWPLSLSTNPFPALWAPTEDWG